MIKGCHILIRFGLDLQLKVTEPFEGENFEILSALLSAWQSGQHGAMQEQPELS